MSWKLSILALSVLVVGAIAGGPLASAQNLVAPARSGDLDALKEAFSETANIDTETLALPLYFAAQRGHVNVVEYLLDQGAAVNSLTKFGSALQIAARGNRTEIITLLLEAGADPNIEGGEDKKTPLHEAAERGALEAARLLVENGADINARSKQDHPPIHLAATKERSEMVDLLRDLGAAPRNVEPIMPDALSAVDFEAGRVEAIECEGCHAVVQGEASPGRYPAPNLAGIVGRPKANDPDFPYSDAMRSSSGNWAPDDLNQFLADPTGTVPGTNMGGIPGILDKTKRTAIIAYLETLKTKSGHLEHDTVDQ